MTAFFDSHTATDDLYKLIATSTDQQVIKAKLFTEKMWACCAEFIDTRAEQAKTEDFCSVWWELYLAYSLTKAGISLVPSSQRSPRRDKGFPDLLATNPRIWIEAVLPEPGNGPDALKEPRMGQAFTVPADEFILRLRTALAWKISKVRDYIEEGTIQCGEAAIIALSAGRLPFRFQDYPIPNIVRALYGVGSISVEIDLESRKVQDVGAEHRDNIMKKSQALVETDLFLRRENSHVSAVLYSSADCVTFPPDPGSDFVLVHNPYANVPVPSDWLGVGYQFWSDGESIRSTPIED